MMSPKLRELLKRAIVNPGKAVVTSSTDAHGSTGAPFVQIVQIHSA
jgi:hypothetical protein